MKKIFKSKKRHKKIIKKIIVFLIISFFVALLLSRIKVLYSDKFISILKYTSMNEIKINNLGFKGEYLLNVGLMDFNKIKFSKQVFQHKKIESEPIIYIYNTHQTEEYAIIKNYNLTPTVLTASYILKDFLKSYNINSIVEESDLKEELNKKGYSFRKAYYISEEWLNRLDNDNIVLYIDLHRDSIKYDLSNVIVDGKDYAKIMFVVGTNYDYKNNYDIASNLINEIEKINKNISRGIYTRASTYNQDYSDGCVLIEIGGPDSTYESVSNTIEVLALAIKNYIGE